MSLRAHPPALIEFLSLHNPVYLGRTIELRNAAAKWLAYSRQTFPHFTEHTIEHSERIIEQISLLLFQDGDPTRPVAQALSATEAYMLVAAAYLHDAGMVVSDAEKAHLLATPTWESWTSGDGAGSERWTRIEQFRAAADPSDSAVRNFLADVQVRFLIAEFLRRTHHERAANVIEQHAAALAQFTFGNPVLGRHISNICVGHGYRPHELEGGIL